MSHRSEESGFRTKASQIVLDHQGEQRLKKRERESEGNQERVQSQMNTLPRSRLKTNCLRLGVLKFSVFTSSNSAFHLLEFILYLTNSLMRAKYLYILNIYIQKYPVYVYCLWRRKSILNNMTLFLDIICVCRSRQRKQLKNMHTSLVLWEVKF